jgi:hypothetical protein
MAKTTYKDWLKTKSDHLIRQSLCKQIQADPDGYVANRDIGFYCAGKKNLVMGADRYLVKALSCDIDDEDEKGELWLNLGHVYQL